MATTFRSLSAIVAFVLIAPAWAAPSEAIHPPSAREMEENKIVCKAQAKTGTRFKEKDCRTRAQWEELRNQQQLDAREMLNRPVICGGGGDPEGC